MSAPRKPSTVAFEGRKTHTNTGGFTEPVTKFTGAVKDGSGKRHSSYPHLSPASSTRAEHVTDEAVRASAFTSASTRTMSPAPSRSTTASSAPTTPDAPTTSAHR